MCVAEFYPVDEGNLPQSNCRDTASYTRRDPPVTVLNPKFEVSFLGVGGSLTYNRIADPSCGGWSEAEFILFACMGKIYMPRLEFV